MQHSTLRIAWRNLGRNRRRTLLAVAAIALGQLTVVFVNCMMSGWFEEMMETVTGPLVGHVQIHHKDWRDERAIDLFIDHLSEIRAQVEVLPSVRSVSPRIYTFVLAASGEQTEKPADAESAVIVGIDVEVESGGGGILESLPPGKLPGGKGVVLGKVLATRLGVEAGDQIAVIGQDAAQFPVSDLFRVKAIVRGKTDVVNRLGILLALEEAQEFLVLPDQAHEILVHGDDYRKAGDLAAGIKGLPLLDGMEILPWREAAPELVSILDMKVWFDLIFLVILFGAAAAGIANTMMMSTFERMHEFGMLLAVGSRPSRIVRMVLLESVVLGLVGVIIGSLLGAGLVFVTSHTGIDYAALTSVDVQDVSFQGINISYVVYPKLEFRFILLGLAAVTLTSVLASLWPAALAARLEPVEAMRS